MRCGEQKLVGGQEDQIIFIAAELAVRTGRPAGCRRLSRLPETSPETMHEMSNYAVVTGATGALGSAIVACLRSAGLQVVAVARSRPDLERLAERRRRRRARGRRPRRRCRDHRDRSPPPSTAACASSCTPPDCHRAARSRRSQPSEITRGHGRQDRRSAAVAARRRAAPRRRLADRRARRALRLRALAGGTAGGHGQRRARQPDARPRRPLGTAGRHRPPDRTGTRSSRRACKRSPSGLPGGAAAT